MIKKLQIRFISIAMLSMLLVTVTVAGAINIADIIKTDSQIDYVLNLISQNQGSFPEYEDKYVNDIITEETAHSIRYLSINVNENGEIVSSNLDHIITIHNENLNDVANDILHEDKNKGYYKNFRYLVTQNSNLKQIVMVDVSTELHERKMLMVYSLVVSILALGVVFILVSIFSRRAIKPVLRNIEQQKEFITNAGHELKTPVAIIMANADVLEMKNGKNDEWVKSIKHQSKRLDTLIKALLELAKASEKETETSEINLSEMTKSIANDFKIIADNNEMTLDIENNVNIIGEKNSIEELVTILLDNAVKYVTKDGKINITLKKNKNNVKLDISNNSENLSKEDCDKIFKRFYRVDESRDRKTGGFGIGLSMAKAITAKNNAKISAHYENGMVHFVVLFNKI